MKIPALAFTSSADLVGQNADGSLEVFTADLSTTPPTTRQLTSASGVTKTSAFPVLSNDGTTIAFTSDADLLNNGTNSDSNMEIFVANFDGSNLRQLTNTPAGTNGPFLSSTGELLNLLGLAINGNGSVVAFTSSAPLGGRSSASQEVFLLGADGGELRQLTTGTVGNSANPNSAINGVSITEGVADRLLLDRGLRQGQWFPDPANIHHCQRRLWIAAADDVQPGLLQRKWRHPLCRDFCHPDL